MSSDAPPVPAFQAYMNPMLAVLRANGGKATIQRLDALTARQMELPADVLDVPHKPDKPGRSEVSYRMAWARSYLKAAGLLANPERGVWELTEQGAAAGLVDEQELASRVQPPPPTDDADDQEPQASAEVTQSLVAELKQLHEELLADRAVLSAEELDGCYRRFRERFGPEVLSNLDGEALLEAMHGRREKDSLVYWLEFKNDEEFPAKFGSIAGGSALKFGLYQSADSGDWITGSPVAQRRLTTEEAVAMARRQRDELLAGADILKHVSDDPETVDYPALQRQLMEVAPGVADSAWGHKYFALLYPQLLDDYHAVDYQNFHLIKLLKVPAGERYENARLFLGIARQLGIPVSNLGAVLNRRDGSPHAYWRVGTTTDAGESVWPEMRDNGYAAVGWNELGDLVHLKRDQQSKDRLRVAMAEKFPARANVVTRKNGELFKFVTWVQPRDLVLAMEGMTVRGIGRVTGEYYYDRDGTFAHRRPVEWLSTEEWRVPRNEGPQTTFWRLGKYPENLVEAERRLLESGPEHKHLTTDSTPPRLPPLSGIPARIQSALQRKRQVILYGPPGTGKTFWAERTMHELVARSWLGKPAGDLTPDDNEKLRKVGAWITCSFHPAYGYEDFLEGYRPKEVDGRLAFERRDGIFKQLCERAAAEPRRHHVLLIDEINRGDVPRIFGELLTVLEKDKRNKPVTLPLSGESFAVPDNVYIIATMNTADRSIALLDAALRRRFAFVELMPDTSALSGASVGGLPLGAWLDELNRRVVKHVGRDARNLQVGHAYLMPGGTPVADMNRFAEILHDDIVPLLEEYCYENFDGLAQILGTTIVQRHDQRIDEALFQPEHLDDLVRALLTAFDTITATKQAVVADAAQDAADEDVDEDEPEADPAEATADQ